MDNTIWVASIGGACAISGAGVAAWATFAHERRRHQLAVQQEVARRALDREQQAFETERELYTQFTLLIAGAQPFVRHMVHHWNILLRFDATAPGVAGERARLESMVERHVALRPELRQVIAHLYLRAPERLASVAAKAFTAAEQVCAGAIFGADAPSMDAAERDFNDAREEFNALAKQKITPGTEQRCLQPRR